MAGTDLSVKRQWGVSSALNAIRGFYTTINLIITDLETLRKGVSEFSASSTWNPSSIADGNEEAKDITVTGAAVGDFVQVSHSSDIKDLVLTASVVSANNVTAVLANNTGGAIVVDTGTLRVRTSSPTLIDAAGDLVAPTMVTIESGD